MKHRQKKHRIDENGRPSGPKLNAMRRMLKKLRVQGAFDPLPEGMKEKLEEAKEWVKQTDVDSGVLGEDHVKELDKGSGPN